MTCAKYRHHVEAIVDLVAPAEAPVDRRVRQEPSAPPVVEPNPPPRAAPEAQRRVFGDAKRRGQVMQQHQRLPAARPKLGSQRERGGQPLERVRRTVEGELVEGDDFVVGVQAAQGRRAGTASSGHRYGPRERRAERSQRWRGDQQIAETGQSHHQDSALSTAAHGEILFLAQ